jgi:hypothetical protein
MADGKILREVEEDAVYITNRRFAEHYEDQAREAEKLERAETKAKTSDEDSSDKKGAK